MRRKHLFGFHAAKAFMDLLEAVRGQLGVVRRLIVSLRNSDAGK